jgi:hypothetical protein
MSRYMRSQIPVLGYLHCSYVRKADYLYNTLCVPPTRTVIAPISYTNVLTQQLLPLLLLLLATHLQLLLLQLLQGIRSAKD